MKEVDNSQTLSDTSMSGQFGLSSLNNADIKRFRKFIVGDDGTVPPDFKTVIKQYEVLSGSLEEIKNEPELIKDFSVKLMNQQAVEFQSADKAISVVVSNVPELQNLFTEPLKISLKTVFSGTTSYLNEQWKIKVADAFNKTLANSFPFAESENDAPIGDFEEFFKPQTGIFWSFFPYQRTAGAMGLAEAETCAAGLEQDRGAGNPAVWVCVLWGIKNRA